MAMHLQLFVRASSGTRYRLTRQVGKLKKNIRWVRTWISFYRGSWLSRQGSGVLLHEHPRGLGLAPKFRVGYFPLHDRPGPSRREPAVGVQGDLLQAEDIFRLLHPRDYLLG